MVDDLGRRAPVVLARLAVERAPVLERPVLERPALERPVVERPVVERPRVLRPRRPARPIDDWRPAVERPAPRRPRRAPVMERRAPAVERRAADPARRPPADLRAPRPVRLATRLPVRLVARLVARLLLRPPPRVLPLEREDDERRAAVLDRPAPPTDEALLRPVAGPALDERRRLSCDGLRATPWRPGRWAPLWLASLATELRRELIGDEPLA